MACMIVKKTHKGRWWYSSSYYPNSDIPWFDRIRQRCSPSRRDVICVSVYTFVRTEINVFLGRSTLILSRANRALFFTLAGRLWWRSRNWSKIVTEIYFLNSVLWKVVESFGVHYVWETLINFDTDFQKIIWTLDIGKNIFRSLPISADWRRCTEPWKVQFQDEIAIWWLLEHVSNITFKVKHLNFWARSHLRYISKIPFCGNPSIFESKVLFMLHAAQQFFNMV